ncbi:mCG1045481 [Mus musculus]|nr:mCG1045481 [Mus musculus]
MQIHMGAHSHAHLFMCAQRFQETQRDTAEMPHHDQAHVTQATFKSAMELKVTWSFRSFLPPRCWDGRSVSACALVMVRNKTQGFKHAWQMFCQLRHSPSPQTT